jgi:hypothetical protein
MYYSESGYLATFLLHNIIDREEYYIMIILKILDVLIVILITLSFSRQNKGGINHGYYSS